MFAHKQILLVAFTLSLPVAIVGMEKPSKHKREKSTQDTVDYGNVLDSILKAKANKKLMGNDLKKQAKLITTFAEKNANNTNTYNPEDLKILGLWLNKQRNSIHSDKAWNLLIEKLTSKIMYNRCYNAEFVIGEGVENLIKEIARSLKPGEDCTESLANEAEKIVQKALAQDY